MEHKLEQILENLWQGEIDIAKAQQQVLALFNVVGQSEHCQHREIDLVRNNSAGYKCRCGKEVTYF